MACKHVEAVELKPPSPSQSVFREECTQCFDSPDEPTGLNVCLYCFNGGCTGQKNHGNLHFSRSHHPLALNIKRVKKHLQRSEPPKKISKLAIAAETEEDRYDLQTKVLCYECEVDNIDPTLGKLSNVIEGVLKASTFARREEVKAWEQELTPCEHTLCLQQESPRNCQAQDHGHCFECDLRENLWLCLQCGNLGCGRAQFGGVGGNSHGLAHWDAAHHPVAVKLGSITPEGTADVYCYQCNEERVDLELASHLAHWGINIAEREKTEKSLTELQIEQNLRWEFSMTTEDGKELKPLYGPGFTGLKNIGNSCYLASILQCVFSLPTFQKRYYHPDEDPPDSQNPAEDLETQLRKVADGLLSGRYSKPDTDIDASEETAETPHQRGLVPAMLKHLIGRGHEEFSTMRQQDAYELLLHLFKLITRSPHSPPLEDPVKAFRFVMEQRLQCLSCKRVRYRIDEQDNISIQVPARKPPSTHSHNDSTYEIKGDKADRYAAVSLEECLDIYTADERVELTCSACGSKDGFLRRSLFKTTPDILAVNARRFHLVNWVPTKLDIPVLVSENPLSLDRYMSQGLQPGEDLLPDEAQTGSSKKFMPDVAALGQLEGMGFPRVRCEKALKATGNADAEAAMNWLFAHMDDPDIDEPVELYHSHGNGAGDTVIDTEQIESLTAMGFSTAQAKKAFQETGGDPERAVDWLFSHPEYTGDPDSTPIDKASSGEAAKGLLGSDALPANFQLQGIVCHKGASIHAGHYVAFIRKTIPEEGNLSWVLFNDEKVVKAADAEEMKMFAYVYFFQRV